MIKKCDCRDEFQDKKYGAGNRVHNKTTTGSRCTVCGENKLAGHTAKKPK